tara:strand:- start:43 stop:165 length:123 start_codon:yes stop_codon:yes gene_type:complete
MGLYGAKNAERVNFALPPKKHLETKGEPFFEIGTKIPPHL